MRRILLSVTLLLARGREAHAQRDSSIAACVNGVPSFPTSAAQRLMRAPALLSKLAWRTAYRDYIAIATRTSYAGALDSIQSRADSLFAAVGGIGTPTREAFRARVRRSRAEVAHWETTHDAAELVSWEIGDLKPALIIPLPASLRAFSDSSGARVMLNFTGDSLPGAIALCAASMTAYQYLEFLRADEVKAVAQMYAGLARRWDLFITDGYSMTLWERLGHSCRLGPLGYVVATFSVAGCGGRNRYALGPPVVQTLFVHPGVGLAPLFDSTGAYRSVAVVEWWGGLYHVYRSDRILTFGLSVASAFSDNADARMRIGGILHTPIGAVGYFEARRGTAGHRGRVTVSADVLGWLPRARAALKSVSSGRLDKSLVGLAKEALTGSR